MKLKNYSELYLEAMIWLSEDVIGASNRNVFIEKMLRYICIGIFKSTLLYQTYITNCKLRKKTA
ncbi:hypothetical protein [Hoylesella nanceiensis]|jgi:hypothetical protein|uniref:hypothetical protein n=1 Tax=Hoylesella nanceiensis TaxID=425941 RepID=UPI001C5D7063|nr:hypothetical protein [Hoylesella nanceiensis]MBW4767743.1 hypothetical protein [Hoylesella nanceiensis]